MKPTFVVFLIAVVVLAQMAAADVPRTMSYQGFLTDGGGAVVPDGDYSLTFRIYSVPTGGSPLFTEIQTLTVTNGGFNAIIGILVALDLAFDTPLWLGVSVDAGPELTPRVALAGAPYAMRAAVADSLDGMDSWSDGDWEVSGSDVYRLAGDVGIGTSDPGERLEVAGTIHSTSGGFRFPDGSLQTTAASGGGGLTLPYSGSVATSGNAFTVTNAGSGLGIVGSHGSSGNFGYLGGPVNAVRGESNVTSGAGVYAKHNAGGNAVHANSPTGAGIEASTGSGWGVWASSGEGTSINAITSIGTAITAERGDGKTAEICGVDYGVYAEHPNGTNAYMAGPVNGFRAEASAGSGAAVYARHYGTGNAVHANSPLGAGIEASTGTGYGMWASSTEGVSIHALTSVGTAITAERGDGKTAEICGPDYAVYAEHPDGTNAYLAGPVNGLRAEASLGSGAAVYARHYGTGNAVHANSPNGTGIEASTGSGAGVWASSGTGDAIHAISSAGYAGYFEGPVRMDGFRLTTGPSNGYVLTSDSSGNGTWQAAPGGSDSDWVISGSNMYSGVSGNVGIGDSTPGAKLDIGGLARIQGVGWPLTGAGLELAYGSSLNRGYVQVYDRGAGEWGQLYLGNGQVGIGVLNPTSKLHVSSGLPGELIRAETSYASDAVHAVSAGTAVYGGGGTGVHGNGSSFGVYGESAAYAGWLDGQVQVVGNLFVSGTVSKGGGNFKIDHPLDPAKKYLNHSFVESPDMKNVYDGVVVLDGSGGASVELPEWFQTLNRDFRYQLTCIGGFAPVYISEKVSGNRFAIAGGQPGMEVCWQVTGIRQDPFAEAYRIPVEEDKPPDEAGYYLHPELYGQPESMSVTNALRSGAGQ